jgi:FdhD protein
MRDLSHPVGTARLPVKKIGLSPSLATEDDIAIEEPLEIRLLYGPSAARQEQPISITMRTPGHDTELAIGFLFTEGIIPDISAILPEERSPAANPTRAQTPCNTIRIALREDTRLDLGRLQRHFYTSSSCGVCGKSSIDALRTVCPPITTDKAPPLDAPLLYTLPSRLRQRQDIFEMTGGLHAAALFDRQGNILGLREDIGRHNALDKLIGHVLQEQRQPLPDNPPLPGNSLPPGNPLSTGILLLSGRACFELIQKAAMAGIKIVAAIGPPSSLAIQLAEEQDMTLIGFLRDQRFNIYTGAHRIRI